MTELLSRVCRYPAAESGYNSPAKEAGEDITDLKERVIIFVTQ